MNPHSIKFRLMALVGALVVVAMLIRVLVAIPISQEELERVTEDQVNSQSIYVARDIDAALRTRQDMLAAMAAAVPVELLGRRAALEAWLGERQRLAPLLDRGLALLAIENQGVLADYPPLAERAKLPYRDSEWFQRALGSQGAVLSRPLRGFDGGEPILVVAAAVRDADGKARAVLAGVVTLSANSLLGRVQAHKVGRTGSLLVVAPAERLVVGATDSALALRPLPAPGSDGMLERAVNGYRGTGIGRNAENEEELVAIAGIGANGWFVLARLPTAEAFSTMIAFKRFVFGFGLVFTVLLVGLLYAMLPRVLRPLDTAARAMRDMADGRRELAPLPILTRDEVGQMLEGFNHLVKRLLEKETALETSEARMSYIAHHDSLTGLYNRAMLEDHLNHAIARATRGPAVFALLFIDLDGFKPINDLYGHDVGDAVLVQVANRLGEGRRRIDTVARHGGDEFVVLLADLDRGRADAEAIASHYLQTLAEPYPVGKLFLHLTASIGIAVFQGFALSGHELLTRADSAMYEAKRAGKNQYSVYGETHDASAASQ